MSIQLKEQQVFENPLDLRSNDKQLVQNLGVIWSRKNLALNVVEFPANTASVVLDYTHNLVVLRSTGAAGYNVTLPPSNSWGKNKSTILIIRHYDTAPGAAYTLNAAAGDTIAAPGAVLSGNQTVLCFCNPSTSTWFTEVL